MSQSHLPLATPATVDQVTTPKIPVISYKNDTSGEVVSSVQFPQGLPDIILGYMGLTPLTTTPDTKLAPRTSASKPLTLFGKRPYELMSMEATEIGNLILHGEEKDVEEALRRISENPGLLKYQAIASDPLGRKVQGTLLQIAAMGGDVNLKDGIVDAKEQGMVERIVSLGILSKEEVAQQLQCVYSEEAKAVNVQRKQRVLAAIIRFGEGLIASNAEGDLQAYQARSAPLMAQLEQDLQSDDKVTTQGYVFDPKILQDAMQWHEDNADRFDGRRSNKSNVFWVNAIGKLQTKLSARDAEVIRAGFNNLVDEKTIPPRTLNNADGSSYFYNADSRLGVDFLLGTNGDRLLDVSPAATFLWLTLGRSVADKNDSIAKLVPSQPDRKFFCQIL